MSLHEEITDTIQLHIDELGAAVVLSPTTLALAVQKHYSEAAIQPHIAYTSLEHLKHLSRRILGARFSVDSDENDAYQSELFAGQLQQRYPIPRKTGEAAAYKLRGALTQVELQWNIEQLAKSGAARLAHARALQAYADDKNAGDQLKAA